MLNITTFGKLPSTSKYGLGVPPKCFQRVLHWPLLQHEPRVVIWLPMSATRRGALRKQVNMVSLGVTRVPSTHDWMHLMRSSCPTYEAAAGLLSGPQQTRMGIHFHFWRVKIPPDWVTLQLPLWFLLKSEKNWGICGLSQGWRVRSPWVKNPLWRQAGKLDLLQHNWHNRMAYGDFCICRECPRHCCRMAWSLALSRVLSRSEGRGLGDRQRGQ